MNTNNDLSFSSAAKSHDRKLLLALCSHLNVSSRRLARDDCGDWIVPHGRGNIQANGSDWIIFIELRSKRQWSSIKRQLTFMRVISDGDQEGRLTLDRMPTCEEAATVRAILGLKKRPSLSKDQRINWLIRLHSANQIDCKQRPVEILPKIPTNNLLSLQNDGLKI